MITIPGMEVGTLIEMIINSFFAQTRRQIDRETMDFSFIQPRTDTLIGMQLRTNVAGKDLKLRVYVEAFSINVIFRGYRLESLRNIATNQETSVWVCYIVLPQADFPTLSRVKNSIPDFQRETVEFPSDSQAFQLLPISQNSGEMLYLTSSLYSLKNNDQKLSNPTVENSGTLNYLTSKLYPIRGNELFQTHGVLENSNLFRPPIIDTDKLTINSVLDWFLLGVSPYSEGHYNWMRLNGQYYEELAISSEILGFTLFVSAIDYNYIDDLINVDSLGLASELTSFTLFLSAIDYNYIRSNTGVDSLTISAAMTNFVLA